MFDYAGTALALGILACWAVMLFCARRHGDYKTRLAGTFRVAVTAVLPEPVPRQSLKNSRKLAQTVQVQ